MIRDTSNPTYLGKEVAEGPSNEGGTGLGGQGVLVESLVVGCPSWNSSTADTVGVAEERAADALGVLAEGFRLSDAGRFLDWVGRDTEGGGDRK